MARRRRVLRSPTGLLPWLGFAGVVLLAPACHELDTTRTPAPRGTVGEEMYGVLCDRVGAQALREDLTGASFRDLCHKPLKGDYADKVDQAKLPPLVQGATGLDGKPVSMEKQREARARAIARIEALARRRADLVRAFDEILPDIQVAVKDIKNADPKKSCEAPKKKAEDRFLEEMADMLGRFTDLYNDGTIPHATQSLARLMKAFKDSPEAQAAWSRFDSRQGYRPIEIALGAARPAIAYPGLRDLANALLRVISNDSNPYDPNPRYDGKGRRIPVAGSAYPQFSKLLEVAHEELRVAKADPAAPPLAVTLDATSGRAILSRPRDNLEVVSAIMLAQDPAFGSGDPRFIVKRDGRGYAQVRLVNNAVPAPFVDKDGDKLPDVDLLGRFITVGDAVAPTPFPALTTRAVQVQRDPQGRPMANGGLLYDYIDTSHTFSASLLADLKPLLEPDPTKQHETLMYAISGASVVFGARTGEDASEATYPPDPERAKRWKELGLKAPAGFDTDPVVVKYNGYDVENSPVLDLVYALGQLMGDRTMDDTLQLVSALMTQKQGDVARVVGAGLKAKDIANAHDEARIPKTSTINDETLDVAAKLAKEPGLLEDVLRALGDPESEPLGAIFSRYMTFNDRITYDRNNINGPAWNATTNSSSEMKTPVDRSKPDTGFNRSAFQRFSELIAKTIGVTACNKEGAVIHARGVPLVNTIDIPLSGTYKECEVFKIENLAKFYLGSIVGKSQLYFRPSILRNGIVGVGAATVGTIEQSSGIQGFWDPPDSKTFRPRPQWLNRLVFFDLDNDSPNPGGKNYVTNHFLRDLNGNIGTLACPERIIDDPDPNAADASPDGKVHGLRNCPDGEWLHQMGADTLFTWENFGFYRAITPLVNAFIAHKREDLFLEFVAASYAHWPSDKASAAECRLSASQSVPHPSCTKEGAVSYEATIGEMLLGDLVPALAQLSRTLQTIKIRHCDAIDATTKQCTKTTEWDGVKVVAEATRAMLDPDLAKLQGLKDRHGKVTGMRQDGKTNPQVTPMYLMTAALNGMDDAFDAYAKQHPEDPNRLAQWRAARSQLVDQFLRVDGFGSSAKFANPALPKITPVLVDVLRSQLYAHCPNSFTPPYERCAWARDELTTKMKNVMKGPTFAATMDLLDGIRKDDGARTEIEKLLQYLLNAASENQSLAAMLASTQDLMQIMRDDENVVPLLHVLAAAAEPTLFDKDGQVVQKGLIDAQTSLLGKISGKYFDKDGVEICSRELDPNQVLSIALKHLVTPMKNDDGTTGETPLEVIIDVIADVNRAAPDQPSEKLGSEDYASIADNVVDFLTDKERGLEQFYEVVRNGTRK
jgi:hypothetical protein